MSEGSQAESPAPQVPEPPTSRPPPKLASRRRIALGALLVVIAITIATVLLLGPSAPWEQAVLARGRTYLDVPLATIFTAPARANETVNTSVLVSFSSGFWLSSNSGVGPSSIFYQWSLVSGTGLPVKFVMGSSWPSDPSSPFSESRNAFDFFPAGPMPGPASGLPPSYLNASAEGPGVRAVLVTKWAMDYTVRQMGVFQGLLPTSYFEIDYSLSVVDRGSVLPLSATNVSLPSSSDLVASALPLSTTPGVSEDLGGLGFSIDSRAPFVDYEPFHYNVTAIALDAGTAGTLQARLMSTSEWTTTCNGMNECWPTASYTLRLSVSNQTVWFQVSLDRRFGSLVLDYVPAPAP